MFGMVPFSKRFGNPVRRDDFFGIDRFFDEFFNDPFFARWGSPFKADIRETDKEWIIDAELPGVDKNNINIEVDDGYLTISVEQNEEINEERENYVRRERSYGSFRRSFFLNNVKEDDIKAVYKNGILTVTLPKAKPDNKRKIQIDVQN
ncbi:Hsp20/alpha crystallin family protein [Thermoclostridium stercorarium]|uniref:Hsp20/alpha crystallin family protein n=1 Tax=Thermoclostridium stercorarium TaxID=1510 RepID=UPI0004B0D013|nr:Hsp20/alpha crystallin family protein [Thermoclostridium stercorarium]UZQ85671.1 Hsp20/alpha crystallin family protein [Thermoclostridium stercorarium]